MQRCCTTVRLRRPVRRPRLDNSNPRRHTNSGGLPNSCVRWMMTTGMLIRLSLGTPVLHVAVVMLRKPANPAIILCFGGCTGAFEVDCRRRVRRIISMRSAVLGFFLVLCMSLELLSKTSSLISSVDVAAIWYTGLTLALRSLRDAPLSLVLFHWALRLLCCDLLAFTM